MRLIRFRPAVGGDPLDHGGREPAAESGCGCASPVPSRVRRIRRGPAGFRRSRSGNVTIVFALSLIPLLGLVGLGVDYGMALSAKSKLDNAADAAAIAAVATAKAYIASNASSQSDPTLTNNAIAAGQDRAARAFAVNAGSMPFVTTVTPNIPAPVRSGQTFSESVSYTATANNNFGKLFGQTTTLITGGTAASADIPSYLDFYLLIDVSGSMGLPSTLAGETLVAANSNGTNCQFACHYPDQQTGYNYAVSNNVQLRSGAVNTAVCNLLALAAQPSVPNQYRVGLYPFITQMATLSPITASISSSQGAATCSSSPPTEFTTLLDTGTTQLTVNNDQTTGTGSGGTHFETTLASIQTTISPYGDGSSKLKSKPFVFLITDGMENTQQFALQNNYSWYQPYKYPGGSSMYYSSVGTSTNYSSYGTWWTGSNPQAMNPSWCATLKQQGATISILYIPYQIDSFQNADTWEISLAQNVINGTPSLQYQLQQCATTGYFYTANTPADINNALAAMFGQAVQVAHLLK